MVTKIIHVNFFIIIVFFFHWIINIFLNDLIEKLNFFFLQKYTNLPCSSRTIQSQFPFKYNTCVYGLCIIPSKSNNIN